MRDRLPAEIRDGVTAALEIRTGRPTAITDLRSVTGGCINPSARVETDGGDAFFLKWNADHPELFGPEADGLEALASEGALRVPEVLAVGVPDPGATAGDSVPPAVQGDVGWLLLEFIPEGPPGPSYDEELAEGLASLHANDGPDGPAGGPGRKEAPAEDREEGTAGVREGGRADGDAGWGWPRDNFIGSLPQSNESRPTWSRFWVEERIRPQLALAGERGRSMSGGPRWDELFRRADELLVPGEKDGPSLLHGDLWSGNVYPGPDGGPVLVDPAVYRGHREVDLAMTELFGGFGADFHRRYREAWPLAPGYDEVRRSLYQLYPLLVHVNLFGGGYASRTKSALERVLAAG